MFYKYFIPVSGLSFNFLNSVFPRTDILNFDEVQFINFFLTDYVFNVISKKLYLIQGHKDFLLRLSFTFKSMIMSGTFKWSKVASRALPGKVINLLCFREGAK